MRRQINDITRALVLSLSVCYHARLQKRDEYEEMIAQEFKGTLYLPGGSEQFRDEIRWLVIRIMLTIYMKISLDKNFAKRSYLCIAEKLNLSQCDKGRHILYAIFNTGQKKLPMKAGGEIGESFLLAKIYVYTV
jgi:hypothetical protein